MTGHPDIVIVCDHGRKGDGRIEHERCDLVAPIIWADEDQGWLPQAPAVATFLDPDNRPRAVVGLEPNNTRLRPGARRDGWTRSHWEFRCPKYSTGPKRDCTQPPWRIRNERLQRLCDGLAGDPAFVAAAAQAIPYGVAVQTGAVVVTLGALAAISRHAAEQRGG
ncbi:hypothetical protein [Mycobacterium shinjukuense]|uniref:Uncharacterized protein n=2 Tax=Mycobacterium shinjukuense TaxID=398694 RepID=A0A7I7MK74_9MYCO|nr:hypothetical protein [Mycobacterium shinjukuense]ORB61635.1 hypothetical protein BST45_19750 [Mycobacterium shinjukuense]BBX72207.1 hypothetical protein MSHI_01130 [Mycobacterium shinjukuense]